jgi:signal transduction histidine kinase
MRLSIRAKAFLTVAFSLIIIFSVIMVILVTDTSHRLRSSLNEESTSFSSLATTPIGNAFSIYQNSGTVNIQLAVNKYMALDPDVSSIQVVSTSGQVLFNSQSALPMSVTASQASSFNPVYKYASGGYIDQIIQPIVDETGIHSYAVVYNVSTARVKQSVKDVLRLILILGVVFLEVSITGTAFMLNRLFLKPLRDLSLSASIISSGNYDQQIASRHKDEIGDLANSLNKMADYLKQDIIKLRDLDKLKSEFMMIASHNLRTPLTIMRGYMDMAKDADTIDDIKESLVKIGDSVNELHSLAEDVLTVSTLEAGSNMQLTATELKPFLDSIGDEFALLAKNKGLHWTYKNQVLGGVKVEINQSNFHSALASLIDNAIKFTKSGGNISTDISVSEDQLIFKISDTGVGVAEEEMPKLFTKFHRGTSTLTYDYEGVGLGLYLSKLIINQHGGKIVINSRLNEGTTCKVTLPLNHHLNDKTVSQPQLPGEHVHET